MHGVEFIQDLAIVMIVAGLTTILCHRFRQPVVLGYMLAGVIIGPHMAPFTLIRDRETIGIMASLGVIFLMFNLGLHFRLRQLREVGLTALIATTLEVLAMLLVGYTLGQAFGWSRIDSVFLGAILSISSTTIIVKTLQDMGLTKERFAKLIFGILIVEDIFAIAMIALLSSIAVTGSLQPVDVVTTFGKLGIFLTALLVFGLMLVPRFLRYVDRLGSNETLLVAVLGLCFGVTLVTVKMGYSEALGAFMIGAIIAEAREGGKIGTLVESIEDLFGAVFFVTIGMMFNPALLMDYWVPVAVITVVVVVGKVVAGSLGAFAAGNDLKTSARVGLGLARIGEFSFIIAGLGMSLKVTSDFLYPIAVTVSAVTTLLTPYLIQSSTPLVAWFDRIAPRPVSDGLEFYSMWVQKTFSRRSGGGARAVLRKTAGQLVLNVVLITAVFLAADFGAERLKASSPWISTWTIDLNALVWLCAMIVALPLFIATVRKLQAFCMMVVEAGAAKREAARAAQGILLRTLPLIGIIALTSWVLLLSAALLPSWPVFIVLSLIIAGVTFLLWRAFVKLYSKAQVAVIETLDEAPGPAEEHLFALPGSFSDAILEMVTIEPGTHAAGKLIRELELRSRTGTTAVGIERATGRVLNPGPDDELRPGDRLLLVGTREHLNTAREYLSSGPVSAGNH